MSSSAKVKPENEVNAYLFYAQRLLYLLSSASLIETQGDRMALTASVCLSLKQAWEAWLKELSGYVGKDITDYTTLMMPENNIHPEIQCLTEISHQANNWLSQLVLFFEPRLNTPSVLSSSGEDEIANEISSSRIDVFQINEETQSDEAKLTYLLSEFKAYINSVRSRQAEW